MLTLKYDAEVDVLLVELREGEPHVAREISDRTILALDRDGEVLGVELLWVSEGVDLEGVPRADEIAAALNRLPRPRTAA